MSSMRRNDGEHNENYNGRDYEDDDDDISDINDNKRRKYSNNED